MMPPLARIRTWRLGPERAAEWREIRIEALREAPDAFDATLAEWQDRPLTDFRDRLAAVPTFATGREVGLPLAVAAWLPGLDPRDPARGWLLSVYARPAARGGGFAAAAITAALADARGGGALSMGLNVVSSNRPAQRLYQRLGFRETGRTGVTNPRGVPETEMILTFDRPALA